MNITALFIGRPVATTLLAIAIALSGLLAYFRLPVAPLPNIAFPVIVVQASMAGASPDIMASTVAEPLERRLGTIADVAEMSSRICTWSFDDATRSASDAVTAGSFRTSNGLVITSVPTVIRT